MAPPINTLNSDTEIQQHVDRESKQFIEKYLQDGISAEALKKVLNETVETAIKRTVKMAGGRSDYSFTEAAYDAAAADNGWPTIEVLKQHFKQQIDTNLKKANVNIEGHFQKVEAPTVNSVNIIIKAADQLKLGRGDALATRTEMKNHLQILFNEALQKEHKSLFGLRSTAEKMARTERAVTKDIETKLASKTGSHETRIEINKVFDELIAENRKLTVEQIKQQAQQHAATAKAASIAKSATPPSPVNASLANPRR